MLLSLHLQVASMISGINPGISASTDSEELLMLQQALLWLMNDLKHIKKYPMAIGKTSSSLGVLNII